MKRINPPGLLELSKPQGIRRIFGLGYRKFLSKGIFHHKKSAWPRPDTKNLYFFLRIAPRIRSRITDPAIAIRKEDRLNPDTFP